MKNNKWVRVAKTATNSNVYFIKNLASETQYKFAVKAYRSICGKEIVSINFPTTTAKTKKETVKIKVINGITYVNGVLIANKTYKLPSTYNPGGLTRETKAAFQKMQQGAAKDNVSLWITSGYRSYSYQALLYNSYVSSNGQAAADRFAARPGYSEHQTGLAIDVNYASSWFNNTTCAKWIENHCAEYGFILRYPRGKESKTGYMYESWHVRYVGVDLAKKVMASGLCLEEYFGITSKYK
ncbi:MAG: M15 family metallopeptidase [Ruminococcus sp.]|nr:M15 family metallopeptidase [Ruminococcus sp.]